MFMNSETKLGQVDPEGALDSTVTLNETNIMEGIIVDLKVNHQPSTLTRKKKSRKRTQLIKASESCLPL